MTYPELIEAYIAVADAMITANSEPEMERRDDELDVLLEKIRDYEAQPGFPLSEEESYAKIRYEDWVVKHGMPPDKS